MRTAHPSRRRTARAPRAIAGLAASVLLAGTVAAGCSSDGAAEPTVEGFVGELEAACAVTATALDAIPSPPDEISVSDFATQAGAAWRDEAARLGELDPPDDLAADHRALIRNDEEQAAAWSDLADVSTGADADTMNELTTSIAQLNLGRTDLVTQMGAPGCARAAAG